MNQDMNQEVERLLSEARFGDDQAADKLFQQIFPSLKQIARALMQSERDDHTLQPTALVHEAWIVWFQNENVVQKIDSAQQLFRTARKCMKQILIDHERKRRTEKRGGSIQKTSLDETVHSIQAQQLSVDEIHEALEALAIQHERPSQVVTLRYYFNLTAAQAAESLGISKVTADSDFRLARAWLHRYLRKGHNA